MPILLIAYDINAVTSDEAGLREATEAETEAADKRRTDVLSVINKSYSTANRHQLSESAYAVETTKSAVEAFNEFVKLTLDKHDALYVIPLCGPVACVTREGDKGKEVSWLQRLPLLQKLRSDRA